MKRLLGLIFFLLLVALGASFAIHNPEPASLSYYFGSFSAPISLIVAIALGLGVLTGLFVSSLMLFSQRRKIARLQRKLDTCEQEIRNLRQLPLRDSH